MRLLCPNFHLLAGLPRCAPQQCESFTVDSSPGVVVQIYGTDPVKIGEEAAMNWWPLSHPTNVLVGMTSPSSANDKGKVGPGGKIRGTPPGDGANTTPGVSLLTADVS